MGRKVHVGTTGEVSLVPVLQPPAALRRPGPWLGRLLRSRTAAGSSTRRAHEGEGDVNHVQMQELISAGLTAEEIAQEMNLSPHEVQGIMDHLGVGMGVTDLYRETLWKWRELGFVTKWVMRHTDNGYVFKLHLSDGPIELNEQQMEFFVQGVEKMRVFGEGERG